MSEVVLPSVGQLKNRMRLLDCVVAVPAVIAVATYFGILLDLSSSQWSGLFAAVGIFAVGITFVFEWMRTTRARPITIYLEALSDVSPSAEICREAFAATIALPKRAMQSIILGWAAAPVVIFLLVWMIGSGGFGLDRRLVVLLVGAGLGGLISGAFTFFVAKHVFADLRTALAMDLSDPEERAALIETTSLRRKIQLVVMGAVVCSSLLTLTLTQSRASRSVDQLALDWQGRVLESLEPLLAGGSSIDEALAEVLPRKAVQPLGAEFSLRRPEEITRSGGPIEERFAETITSALAEGRHSGGMLGGLSGGAVSWQRTSDGRLLLAVSAAADGSSGVDSIVVVALLLSLGLSLGVAFLLSEDFKRATRTLCEEAERMALGDLRRGRVWEAEDEMGELSRAFERMALALRATVGRVAEAADRVDAAAGDITSVSQGVAVASADQVRRIQQVNELMGQITDQVGGVSESAQALNVSIEESSSSILELGAAGDELNDTASVLSSKVEEVSGSIEQMVRSVKQVSSTTESLSDAAGETSSSMEEMASAMKSVDTSAELTAKLSSEVVTLAESGQQKVSQTIQGMEAIRDATDAAEHVIKGLGTRAREIGGILDVIDDVADETNLLALNAAIIAAQAGEHGRAFSVVADEIKELADRVLASTKEIGGLIRSVQEESENAVGAIEVGSESVAGGVELSAEAGTALEEITRASRESGTRIGGIVTAVREQTRATAHVVGLMEAVRDGVQQISVAGSEQDKGNEIVYRSAVTMREVAQQVRRTTEEQSRGFSRIRESVEGVRIAVESINTSLQDQSEACSQVASFLEQVFDGTRSNEEAAQRMGEAMQGLLSQAQALRDDVAKFTI